MVVTFHSSLRIFPSLILLLGLLFNNLHDAVAEPTNFYKSVSVQTFSPSLYPEVFLC